MSLSLVWKQYRDRERKYFELLLLSLNTAVFYMALLSAVWRDFVINLYFLLDICQLALLFYSVCYPAWLCLVVYRKMIQRNRILLEVSSIKT